MKTRYKVVIVLVGSLSFFALGRFTSPAKVITQIKTVTVKDKKSESNASTQVHKVVTKRKVVRPDGTIIVDTTTKDDTTKEVDTSSVSQSKTETEETKTIIKDKKRVNLSLLAGENLSSLGAPI